MKKPLIILIALIIIAAIVYLISASNRAPIGDTFKVSYSPESARDMIRVDDPEPGEKITSPLKITGEARGNWFFEATFPVVLVDWDGIIIAEGYATAKDEWMTTDFVPFEATLEFIKPEDKGPQSIRGALILKRDNPSGLPENDAAAEIPVIYK